MGGQRIEETGGFTVRDNNIDNPAINPAIIAVPTTITATEAAENSQELKGETHLRSTSKLSHFIDDWYVFRDFCLHLSHGHRLGFYKLAKAVSKLLL